MKAFPANLIKEFKDPPEVRIETVVDGTPRSTIIWIVTTGDGVFVRSYHGSRGKWYQRLLRDRTGVLRVGRRRVPIRAEPDADPQRNRRVDEAYSRKYGSRWPGETEAMVKPASVRRTTLRVTPA